MKTNLDSANLDPNVKELFQLLIEENKEITKSVIQLESSVQQLSIKTNELERYNSKDSDIQQLAPGNYWDFNRRHIIFLFKSAE